MRHFVWQPEDARAAQGPPSCPLPAFLVPPQPLSTPCSDSSLTAPRGLFLPAHPAKLVTSCRFSSWTSVILNLPPSPSSTLPPGRLLPGGSQAAPSPCTSDGPPPQCPLPPSTCSTPAGPPLFLWQATFFPKTGTISLIQPPFSVILN